MYLYKFKKTEIYESLPKMEDFIVFVIGYDKDLSINVLI